MKIIESPNPSAFKLRHTCSTCYTVVELGIDDIRGWDGGYQGVSYGYNCPSCKRANDIKSEFIPLNLRYKVKFS